MFIISERINGMFRNVRNAITEKNVEAIQQIAKEQLAAGADALDINVGPASADKIGTMQWMIESIQEVTDKPLCLDTPIPGVMEAALKVCDNPKIINSTNGEQEKLDALLPLAAEYNAEIIGLAMDSKGIPRDAAGRVEIALQILASAMEHGIEPNRLYIDPVILPVNAVQQQAPNALEALNQIRLLSDPPPKTVIGLSNISQGAKIGDEMRSLLNRTYVVMCIANGLDAAIVDPGDRELVDSTITADLLMNKAIYADDFLKAYRASKGIE
jgi:5-methyltetrahydrofolate corrinoid/iron sulfur protein methyltransferase